MTTKRLNVGFRDEQDNVTTSRQFDSSRSVSLDKEIDAETSRLLEVYGADAVNCLEQLAKLLQQKVEFSTKLKQQRQNACGEEDDSGDDPLASSGCATTTNPMADLQSIVLQTIHLEQQLQQHSDTLASQGANKSMLESVSESGFQVLRYLSTLQQTQPEILSPSISSVLSLVENLCESMTKYPQNERLQESACVTLSQQPPFSLLSLILSSTNISAPSAQSEMNMQRILFPVLQAMNWHKYNSILWNAGMMIITHLLSHRTQNSLENRQTEAMSLLDLTGGLNIFFDALTRHQTASMGTKSTNKAVQMDLKVHVCEALAALCLNHSNNQAALTSLKYLQQFSTLLDTMKLYDYYLPLQQAALQLLASLAYGGESKSHLLTKGGLDAILTCLNAHPMQVSIQATGCRAIANIFAETPLEIRASKGRLCIKPILRAMRTHPPAPSRLKDTEDVEEQKQEDSVALSHQQIHFYGCAALKNLAKVLSHSILDDGGLATLLVTISGYRFQPNVQEQAWGVLYLVLSKQEQNSEEASISFCTEGGLDLLLDTLRKFAVHERIQMVGLGCLAFLSSSSSTIIPSTTSIQSSTTSLHERIVSEKALDDVMAALYRFHKTNDTTAKTPTLRRAPLSSLSPSTLLLRMELLQHGCRILYNISRDSPDFELAVIGKNGINVCIMILQEILRTTKTMECANGATNKMNNMESSTFNEKYKNAAVRVQMAATNTLCNLARNPDNLHHFALLYQGAQQRSSLLTAILSTLSQQKRLQPPCLELISALLELLSYLATIPSIQSEFIRVKGIALVVEILQNDYATENKKQRRLSSTCFGMTVLDFGVNCLFICSENQDATSWMKRNDNLPTLLQRIERKAPRGSTTRTQIRALTQHLRSAQVSSLKMDRSWRTSKTATNGA